MAKPKNTDQCGSANRWQRTNKLRMIACLRDRNQGYGKISPRLRKDILAYTLAL
jgi:hypothetical protein